jgi:hypothetical protein
MRRASALCADGIRQDFILTERLAGKGAISLVLVVIGNKAVEKSLRT